MFDELRSILEALKNGQEDQASSILREYFGYKVNRVLNEDHEKIMTSDEMEQHIIKLHGKAPDKEVFLKKLAQFSDLDACSEEDFRKCADNIQSKGKVFMDKAIHSLEKLIGYKFDPKTVVENLGNVITRPSAGVPDGGASIPNVYITKSIPKKKKKLPSLKKSVYGTGYAPLSSQPASGGEGSGGDAGGGDGGGGGE